MSQVTVTTTTPPVTVMCSSALSTSTTFTVVLTSIGLAAALGQHDVVLSPSLISRLRGIVGLTIVPKQQPQCQVASQAYASFAMGLFSGEFSFSDLSLSLISIYWYL